LSAIIFRRKKRAAPFAEHTTVLPLPLSQFLDGKGIESKTAAPSSFSSSDDDEDDDGKRSLVSGREKESARTNDTA
jgi:hypothetical protein